jgi:hypothetical protein
LRIHLFSRAGISRIGRSGVLNLRRDLEAQQVQPSDMADAITLAQFYLSEASRLTSTATVSAEINTCPSAKTATSATPALHVASVATPIQLKRQASVFFRPNAIMMAPNFTAIGLLKIGTNGCNRDR